MALAFFSSIHCDFAPVAFSAPVIAPFASSYTAHSVNHAIAPAAPVVAAYTAGVPAAYTAGVPAAYSALPYPYAYPYLI